MKIKKCILCKEPCENAIINGDWLCKSCLKKIKAVPACKVNIDFDKILKEVIK